MFVLYGWGGREIQQRCSRALDLCFIHRRKGGGGRVFVWVRVQMDDNSVQ